MARIWVIFGPLIGGFKDYCTRAILFKILFCKYITVFGKEILTDFACVSRYAFRRFDVGVCHHAAAILGRAAKVLNAA